MGCDIHLHTEVKIDGVWHHYGTPNVSRSYELFSRLADVRNERKDDKDYIQPIAEPRGVPDDATVLTRYDCARWEGDGHSHSWIGAQEIADLADWAKARSSAWLESERFGYLFGNDWSGFAKYADQREPGLEDVRFIFWFDN